MKNATQTQRASRQQRVVTGGIHPCLEVSGWWRTQDQRENQYINSVLITANRYHTCCTNTEKRSFDGDSSSLHTGWTTNTTLVCTSDALFSTGGDKNMDTSAVFTYLRGATRYICSVQSSPLTTQTVKPTTNAFEILLLCMIVL